MVSIKLCSSSNLKFLQSNFVVIYTRKPLNIPNISKTWIASAGHRQLSSTVQPKEAEFTCKEIGVPVPGGTLAGKLWESTLPNTSERELPPVLCLHGWLDNAGTFDLILPFMMNPSLKYFCLDFPGHGLTTYCPDWWYDAHLEGILAVRRVVRHFGWEKYSILGHSLGGIVGCLHAGYFPDEVHKLVALENMRPLPVPFQNNVDMMRASINLLFLVEERMKKPKKTYDYNRILKKLYDGRQGTISKEGCIALLKRGATKMADNHYHFSYNLRTSIPGQEGRTPPDLSIKLAKEVTSPVCFIKADPGNTYDTPEESEKFLSIFRNNLGENFEHHIIPGTHHFHLNDPQVLANIILKFLMK